VAVLIVTCPCALSLATPVALAAAASRLARSGVLVVDPDAIEKLAAVRRAVFDKTGSLTTGVLTLESIELLGALDRARCLALARALERSAAHPMALALRAFVTVEGPDDVSCSAGEIIEQPGAGVQALIDGRRVRIGTAAFARALHGRPAPKVDAPGSEARSVAWLADESGWLARFVFSDPLRADAHDTVAALQRHGLDLAILSGDAPEVVAQAAQTLSIGESAGALRPEDKCEQLAQWQRAGQPIAMVGDGVNDGPVLAQADVSIALASAAPLAQHCATIVLLENRLRAIVDAFDTATRTARIVRQNLGWALAYNIASVPLAALGYVPPWLAGLGMALSSLLVVANSIRLLHPPARGDGRAIA
jgi:Cu2+-exporting ATPase